MARITERLIPAASSTVARFACRARLSAKSNPVMPTSQGLIFVGVCFRRLSSVGVYSDDWPVQAGPCRGSREPVDDLSESGCFVSVTAIDVDDELADVFAGVAKLDPTTLALTEAPFPGHVVDLLDLRDRLPVGGEYRRRRLFPTSGGISSSEPDPHRFFSVMRGVLHQPAVPRPRSHKPNGSAGLGRMTRNGKRR